MPLLQLCILDWYIGGFGRGECSGASLMSCKQVCTMRSLGMPGEKMIPDVCSGKVPSCFLLHFQLHLLHSDIA